MIHIADLANLRTLGSGLCAGQPEGVIPTFDTDTQRKLSEIKGYTGEAACLRRKLDSLKAPCDEACKQVIEDQIRYILRVQLPEWETYVPFN